MRVYPQMVIVAAKILIMLILSLTNKVFYVNIIKQHKLEKMALTKEQNIVKIEIVMIGTYKYHMQQIQL